jgi:hypothetical protein
MGNEAWSLFQYVPSAEFLLSEKEFSMNVNMTYIPSVMMGDKGSIRELYLDSIDVSGYRSVGEILLAIKAGEWKSTDNWLNQWGKIAKDPKLYLSLVGISDGVKAGNSFSKIKFDWSSGYVEFFKPIHKLGQRVERYFEREGTRLLGVKR